LERDSGAHDVLLFRAIHKRLKRPFPDFNLGLAGEINIGQKDSVVLIKPGVLE
jgi:hypothetical protein